MTNLDMTAAGNTEPLGELSWWLHCAGEYETALDDADAAIADLDGTVHSDDTLLVKAHYRRVSSNPIVARLSRIVTRVRLRVPLHASDSSHYRPRAR